MKKNPEPDYLQQIVSFLCEIGIEVRFAAVKSDSFLPGISIENGELLVDVEKLKHPGDLLHEAGHVAVQPAQSRASLNENVNDFGQNGGDEMAAIAWSWAALKKIGLPPSVVFHPKGYKGASNSLIECFETGGLMGQPLLNYYGMCGKPNEKDGFPKMENWLRR